MRKTTFLLLSFLITAFYMFPQSTTEIRNLKRISAAQDLLFQQQRAEITEYSNKQNVPIRFEKNGIQYEMQYIDEFGRPQYYITHNAVAAESISTDEVYSGGSAGLSLDGTGQVPREWDAGSALSTHQEFDTRLTNADGGALHFHANHVAGTIIASGVDSDAKGMAYAAELKVFDWNNDESEMAGEAVAGALVSNHSYGFVRGWSSGVWYGTPAISTQEDYLFGFYDSSAEEWDQIAYNAPNYLIVKSAGNDRGECGDGSYPCDGDPDGYDCMSQKSIAKNILTVGAVDDIPGGYSVPGDVEQVFTSFSSWGPADDGRIKPDIVANGYELWSTWHTGNDVYNDISGTSMATPSVTGSISLLHQHYEDEFGTGSKMWASTTKALVLHTADEAGDNEGPDYAFGWGLMNTKTAAEKITEDIITDVISEKVLADGESYTRDILTTGTNPIRVTIVWTDPAGTPPAASLDPTDLMLINDLDLQIENVTTRTVYYPWKLDGSDPDAAATNTTENNVDNVLMVDITSPTNATTYTITVDHDGTLEGGMQAFSLIISGDIDNAVAPVADFTASETDILVDDAVNFTDASDNIPTSWSWTFTPTSVVYLNGTSATSQNPEVQFTAEGDYTVELLATNANGSDTETKTDYITVEAPVEWTGTVNDSWDNAGNWDSGIVPDETIHVVIPSGKPNYPVITGDFNVDIAGAYACRSMKIENGGTVTVGSTTTPTDMFVYGDLTVETGGTLELSDDLDVQSGGNLIITGGTVTNFYNSGGFGDFMFRDGSGGYMTSGSIIIYDYIAFEPTTTWSATGGTFICDGNSDAVDIEIYSPNVFIEDFLVEQNTITFLTNSTQSFEINGDATFEPGSYLLVDGANTMNISGDATLESTSSGSASLIEYGTFNVTGTLTVERYITDDQWHLLASPVDNTTVNSLYFNGNPDVWLKQYLEPTNTWDYITSLSTPMPFGNGFAVWVEDAPRSDVTIEFTGPVNKASLVLNSLTWGGDTDHGYNLVGNPFPHPISWDAGSWDTTNINGSIWVWQDGGQGDGSGNYLYRNAQQQGNLTDGVIPTAQGFFVQANNTNPSLTIPFDAWVITSQDFYKSSEFKEYEGPPYAVFTLNNTNYVDEAWITFCDNCTNQFDNGWDVNKLFGDNASQLYVKEGELKLSIDALPPLLDKERIVALWFEADEDGDYSMALNEIEKLEDTEVFLEDKKTGQVQDMIFENTYHFNASTTDEPDRFLIHFNPVLTSVELPEESNNCHIYAYNKKVYIKLDDSFVSPKVEISDLYGRKIIVADLKPASLNSLSINYSNAYLVVRVIDEGQSTGKNVFIY